MKNCKISVLLLVVSSAIGSVAYAGKTSLKCNCGYSGEISYKTNIENAVGTNNYSVECAHKYDIATTDNIDIEETDAQIFSPSENITTVYNDVSKDDHNWSTFSIGPRDDEKLKSVTDYNDGNFSYNSDNYSGDWKKNKLNEFTLKLNDENSSGDRTSHFNVKTSGKDYEGYVIIHSLSGETSVTNTIYGLCLENLGHEGDQPPNVASVDKEHNSKAMNKRSQHKKSRKK